MEQEHTGIQRAALSLINAMFQKADYLKKKVFRSTISSRQYRYIINHSILNHNQDNNISDGSIDQEMSHQLYVLQQLLLNQYEDRMKTCLDPSDNDATERIKVKLVSY